MKKHLIKSTVFIIVYALTTITISFFKEGKDVIDTLGERWYEYIILFLVVVWFNVFIDKKNKKRNKNKFYREL